MLTPEQLGHCADTIVELYSELNEAIIRDVARRIAKTATVTDTGKLQLNALQNLGILQQDVIASVAKYNNISEEELQKIFADASASAVEFDSKIYRANGLDPLPLNLSPSAMQILEAGYNKTKGNITNLTRTTAVSTQTKFISACTMAEMKAESGAFTPEQAIFDAVKLLASEGATVIYPSGHEDKIDVAVRRNVMTGIGQTTGEICLSYAEDLGCDLMEITAHAGARPSHAAWQGKIVSLSGKDGYLSLDDIGYGTGAGFKGWNCRHDWYPYFEDSTRMYSEQELAALEEKNIEFPDGSMHTLYEAEQYQRSLERRIRETKRVLAAKDELLKNCSEDLNHSELQVQFDKYSVKLKSQETQLKAFCQKTGVRPDSSRTKSVGFGKSTAQKAVQREKANIRIAMENFQYQQYLQDLKNNKVSLKSKQEAILQKIPGRNSVDLFKKKQVNIKDLAALTAYTGDEFALFYKGKRAIVVHGSPTNCNVYGETYDTIISEKWVWIAHSHPTTTKLMPSQGDIDSLKLFTWQKESSIIDLKEKIINFSASQQDYINLLLGVKT